MDLSDSLLWWVAAGVDAINLIAQAVEATGSTAAPGIIAHWNGIKSYPGYFGDYSYSPENHNGYPADGVVMSDASSARNGTFKLAPGYKA